MGASDERDAEGAGVLGMLGEDAGAMVEEVAESVEDEALPQPES